MDKKIGDVIEDNGKRYECVQDKFRCDGCEHPNSNHYGCCYSNQCACGSFILKEIKMFTKEDLKEGDVVTRRDGVVGVVSGLWIVYTNTPDHTPDYFVDNYYSDLCWLSYASAADIIKVERPVAPEVLYERPTEPVIEVIVKVDGKECKLSTLSEETLLSIHKISKEN